MRVIFQIWPFGVILQNLTPKNFRQKILSRMVKKSESYHIQRLGNRQFKIQPVFSGISDIRFAKNASCRRVSKPFLSRSFEIFEIGSSISEKNSCKKPFRWKKNTPKSIFHWEYYFLNTQRVNWAFVNFACMKYEDRELRNSELA